MTFNSSLAVDFVKWKTQNMSIKMERENNLKEYKGADEESPKYVALPLTTKFLSFVQ